MAVTTQIYSGGQVYETISGSDGSVTQRVLDAQGKRIQDQVEANQKSPYTFWDGAGRIRDVGGNAPYRPRQVQANSGLGKGDPVQDNGGLVSATPRAGDTTDLQAQIKAQADQITNIAKSLGGQFGNGDANTEADPRYLNDTYYDLDSGTLFKWDTDEENSFTDPKWVPLSQVFQTAFSAPDSGNADALAATVYVDGAIAINAAGEIYTGDATADEWTLLSGGGGVLTLTTDPTTAGTPVQDDLLVIDKTTGDQYYADNSDPQVWAKQPSGGGASGLVYYLVAGFSGAVHNGGVTDDPTNNIAQNITLNFGTGSPTDRYIDYETAPGNFTRNANGTFTVTDAGVYKFILAFRPGWGAGNTCRLGYEGTFNDIFSDYPYLSLDKGADLGFYLLTVADRFTGGETVSFYANNADGYVNVTGGGALLTVEKLT